jgi:phosphoesterase RecJ-like protein
MNKDILAEIGVRLHSAEKPMIISHIRPDGDAVGSLLGLGLALQVAGKEAQMVLADPVPPNLRQLPGARLITRKPEGPYDLIVVLDSSDLLRTGNVLTIPHTNGQPAFIEPDINIDHHVTNLNFAHLNYVDVEAVATSEILARILPEVGFQITETVASVLLTGIITDTLGFMTSNMTPRALRVAADLMEAGANLPELYTEALKRRSFQGARLWGLGLVKLQREGPIIWTSLTLTDRRAVEYPGKDDADLINILSSIEDASVALIFVEQAPEEIKVSWRSQPGVDVSKIALAFGGGGHPAASGAMVKGSLEEVQERVLQATRALILESQVG